MEGDERGRPAAEAEAAAVRGDNAVASVSASASASASASTTTTTGSVPDGDGRDGDGGNDDQKTIPTVPVPAASTGGGGTTTTARDLGRGGACDNKDGYESESDVESWPSSSSSSSSSSLSSMGEIRDIVLDLHALVHAAVPPPSPPKPTLRKVQLLAKAKEATAGRRTADGGVTAATTAAADRGDGPGDDGGGTGTGSTGGNDDVDCVDDEGDSSPPGVVAASSAEPPPRVPPLVVADDWSFSSVEVDDDDDEDDEDEVEDEVNGPSVATRIPIAQRRRSVQAPPDDDDQPNQRKEDPGDLVAGPHGGDRTSNGGISGTNPGSSSDGGGGGTTTTAPGRSKEEDGDVQAVAATRHRGGPDGRDGEREEVVAAGGAGAVTEEAATFPAPASVTVAANEESEASGNGDGDDDVDKRSQVDDDDDATGAGAGARRRERHRRWDSQLDRAARSIVAAATRATASASPPCKDEAGEGGAEDGEAIAIAAASSGATSTLTPTTRTTDVVGPDGHGHGHGGPAGGHGVDDDDNCDDAGAASASRLLLARRLRLFYGALVLAHCGEVEGGGGEEKGYHGRGDASEEGGNGEDARHYDDSRQERRHRHHHQHSHHVGWYRRYYRDVLLSSPRGSGSGSGSGRTTDDAIPMSAARLLWEEVCLSVADRGGDDGGGDGGCHVDLEAILGHAFVGRQGRPHADTSPNSKLDPSLDADEEDEEEDFVPLLLLGQPATTDDGMDDDGICDGVCDGGHDDDDDASFGASSPPSRPLLRGCLFGDAAPPLRIPPTFGIDAYRDYALHLLEREGGQGHGCGCDGDDVPHAADSSAAPTAADAAEAELDALLVAVRACQRRVLAEHGGEVSADAGAGAGADDGDAAMAASSCSSRHHALLVLPYLLLRAAAAASSVLAMDEDGLDPLRASLFRNVDDDDYSADDPATVAEASAAARRRAQMLWLRDRLLASAGTLLLRSRWFLTRRIEAALLGAAAAAPRGDADDEVEVDSSAGRVAMEAVELHVRDVELWMLLLLAASSDGNGGDGGLGTAAFSARADPGNEGGGAEGGDGDGDGDDGGDDETNRRRADRPRDRRHRDILEMGALIADDGRSSGGGGRREITPFGSAAISEGYQLLLSCLERWNKRDGDGDSDSDDDDDGDEVGPEPSAARHSPSAAATTLTPSTLLHVLGQTSHLLAQSLSGRHLLLSRAVLDTSAAASRLLPGGRHGDENERDGDGDDSNERNYDDGAMTLYGRALHYYGLLGSSLSSSPTKSGPGGDGDGDGDGDESPWDWMEDDWSDDDISGCGGGVDDEGSEKGSADETACHRRQWHRPITQRDVNDMRAVVLCHMGQHSEVFEDYRSAITYYGEAVLIWRNPNLWRYKLSTLSGNHWEDYESFNEFDDDGSGRAMDGEDWSDGNRHHHHHRGPNSNVCIGDMLHRLGVAHAYLGEFDKAVECLRASSEVRKKLVAVVRGDDVVEEGGGRLNGAGDEVGGDGGVGDGTPALERMLHHHRHHEDTLTLSSLGWWRRRPLRQRGDSNGGNLGGGGGAGEADGPSSPPSISSPRCCTKSSLRRRREMDLADTLQWLATCHRELGKSDLALTCFRDCLSIKTQRHGRNHVEVASLYYYIGIVYDDMGRHELSLEHYQDAVRIRRHVEAAFYLADEKKTELCSNGSSREPAYDAAEEGQRMLARRENSHEMVNAFVCMGNIFLNMWKRKLEALEYFSEAIRLSELLMDMRGVERGIDEAYTLGGVGFSVTTTNSLAGDDGTHQSDSSVGPISSTPLEVENKNGEYERMLECYQILLDLVVSLNEKIERRRPHCGTSTEILHGIARVHMAQRRWDAALLVLRRKLSILHDKWKDHPHAAGHAPKENKGALEAEYENTLYVMGHVMFKLRQFDQAIQSYNDVLVAWRTKCDPGETSVFLTQIVCALYNKGNCHRELREYDHAMKCFEEVSILVEDLLSLKYDERVALVRANNWYQIANAQLLQGNCTIAARYLEKSHNFFNGHYGRNHLCVGLSLQGMGEVHHQAKRHYRALECYLEAARVYRVAASVGHGGSSYDAGFAGEISHFMGDALHNIGALHEAKDELDGAMTNYEEALRLYRSKFGSVHLSIAKTLANMARICVKQHRYTGAEELLGEALSIRREILGTDHQDVAKTLMSLGRVHDELHSREQGVKRGSSEAMSCYEEALRIRRKTLGEHHPDVAASWNMVGRIHTNLQEYDKAFECLEKALVLRQELLGHSHQDTACTYHNLGNAHAMRGAYGKALKFYMSAYGIQASKRDDPDHMSLSSTCHNIASVHSMLGDTSKAKMWYGRALEIREKNMPESEALAQTLYKLGALELETKDYDVALTRFRRSLGIMRLQCDELAKFELASILNDIATVCALHKKDFEQAIDCCAEVVQIMNSDGSGDSEEVANAQNMLGYIYSNKAESYYDVDMAIQCHESALSILRTKNEANDTACIARTLCSLGVCYVNSLREVGNNATKSNNDDVKKAMEYLNECISIFKHQVHSKDRRLQSADRTRELARAFYFKGLLHVQSANDETDEKDDAEALKCFEESLDLFRAVTDEASTTDAFIKARVLQKLGMMSTKCRDYDRAMLCFGEALQLGLRAYHNDQDEEELSFRCEYDYDEGFAGVKEKGIAVAEIYFGMGIVSCERRDHDYEKSLYFYQKCLEMRLKNIGPQHMDVAQTLNNIGSVYARQKKFGEAMDYWMQALKMYNETGLSDTDEKFKCTQSNIELAKKLVAMPQRVKNDRKPLTNQPASETFID